MSQIYHNNGKITWIALQIASTPTYSLDLAPSDHWLFADLKRMLQRKRLISSDSGNWGVFWGQRQIVLQKGIKLLEKRWNQCITLEGDYWWIKSNFAWKLFY